MFFDSCLRYWHDGCNGVDEDMCPSDSDVMEMAKLQAEADGQSLTNLFVKTDVKGWQDMPKLWVYLTQRQREDDVLKQEEEMRLEKVRQTHMSFVNETQDIFDQILNMETQDDEPGAVFGAPQPSLQVVQHQPAAAQQSSRKVVPLQPAAAPPPFPQVVPHQHAASPHPGPPVTPQQSAPQLGAPQPVAPQHVAPQLGTAQRLGAPVYLGTAPETMHPLETMAQAQQQGAPAQPPQQGAQSPLGQAQGQGAQGSAGQPAGTGVLNSLAVGDVKNPSREAPNEYRSFCRQAKNRDSFPVGLQQAYKGDKLDLFNTWRRCGKDWGKTETSVKRKASKLTEALGEKCLVKVRDLVRDGMPLERALSLRDKRKKENLCVADPDFPDIEDEIQFWHTTKVAASTINRTEESMSVTGTAEVEGNELTALIGDDGVLCAGLHVAAPGVSVKNQMAFAESLGNLVTNEGTGKLKLTAKPKEVTKVVDVPVLTPKQIAMGVCDDIQKEIKEAHNLEMVLTVP